MNTPPRFFAAPPPSPGGRKRLSALLGAALIGLWLLSLPAVVLLRLPPVLIRASLLVLALAWAGHVASVVLHNRRLDRGRGSAE